MLWWASKQGFLRFQMKHWDWEGLFQSDLIHADQCTVSSFKTRRMKNLGALSENVRSWWITHLEV